jgi:hypothetical protein
MASASNVLKPHSLQGFTLSLAVAYFTIIPEVNYVETIDFLCILGKDRIENSSPNLFYGASRGYCSDSVQTSEALLHFTAIT